MGLVRHQLSRLELFSASLRRILVSNQGKKFVKLLWRLAVKSEVWVKFILTLDCSWHLHNKTVISFLPGCARQTESHSNSIPRFLIEIYAGKVVSLAWEPPDSGENGYEVPENIAAWLISTALPWRPGPTGSLHRGDTWTRITLVEVIKRSASEEVVKALSVLETIYWRTH